MKYKKIIFCALSLLTTTFSHSMQPEATTVASGLMEKFDRRYAQRHAQQMNKKEEQAALLLNYAELLRNSEAARLTLKIFATTHEPSAHTNNHAPRPDYRPIPPTIGQPAPIASHLLRPTVREIERLREECQQEDFLYQEPSTLNSVYDPIQQKQEQNHAQIEKDCVDAARLRATMPTMASCYPGRTAHIISCSY